MSLLYKALLKDQQNNNAQPEIQNSNNPAGLNQQGQFVPPQSYAHFAPAAEKQIPYFMWFTVVALVLVVGLMGGYLFALNHNSSTVKVEPEVSNAKPQQELAQQNQVASPSITGKTTTEEFAAEDNEPLENDNSAEQKTVSIAIDEQGKVVSHVTEDTNGQTEQINKIDNETLLAQVPDELKQRFNEAVVATQSNNNLSQPYSVSSSSSLTNINDLPELERFALPSMHFQMHIYASEKTERWIKINDKVLYEGDELEAGLSLFEIRQQQIIWQKRGKRFSHEALVDFQL